MLAHFLLVKLVICHSAFPILVFLLFALFHDLLARVCLNDHAIPICHCFKVVDSNNNTCFFFWNNNGCCISYGCTRASANPASDIQSACLWPNQWRCLPFFRHRRAEAIMVLTTQACLKSWPAFNLTGMLVVKSCNDCCC